MAIARRRRRRPAPASRTVCFQRFWLMMKSSPRKTPMASGLRALQAPGEQREISARQHRRHQQQDVDQPVEQEIQAVGEGPEDGVEIVGEEAEERLSPGAYRDLVLDQEFRNRIHLTPLVQAPSCSRLAQRHLVTGYEKGQPFLRWLPFLVRLCRIQSAQLPSAVLTAAAASPPSKVVTPAIQGVDRVRILLQPVGRHRVGVAALEDRVHHLRLPCPD